ncbi:50S ribosomal protein L15 [Candidatus Phytoplasma palmae]
MLNSLKPVKGSRKTIKRLGRGPGSGNGKTSGRGSKGQLSRSGGNVRIGFEGGQTPFFQRIPKRGFHNINKKEYSLVNLQDLEIFEDGTLVNREILIKNKIIKKNTLLIKILSKGNFTKKLTVQASKFSKKSKEIIEKNGGIVEILN